MELYIDTADLNTAEKLMEYYPIDGITTNPKILAGSKEDKGVLFRQLKEFTERHHVMIFVQVTGNTAEKMLSQAKAFHRYFGDLLVVKVPALAEGYKAVRMCRENQIPVCVTVIHSAMQAIIAAKAGADYVAPYISHIDNMGKDAIETVGEMRSAFANGRDGCKVLGASFRTVDQIKRLAAVGCEAVTVAPDLFEKMISHPATDECMGNFRKAWKEKFGELQADDLIEA